MGKQHAQGDAGATGVIRDGLDEFRHKVGERDFEMQDPALVEDHRDRGCGDDFGQRGEVEDCVFGDAWGFGVVGEVSQGGEVNLFFVRDGKGCSGKGVCGDGLFQDVESLGKSCR